MNSTTPKLISAEYLEQLQLYRKDHRPMWGNGGGGHFRAIQTLIQDQKPKTILDYGCGHGLIVKSLLEDRTITEQMLTRYDPGIEEISAVPQDPVDFVICTDVLEHIEPDCLSDVLAHISFLTSGIAYINIHTSAAKAILPDGRNAHLIQEPGSWWADKLREYYGTVELFEKTGSITRPTFLCYG